MFSFFPAREVIVSAAGFQIRWYGLLYVVAFWLAWWMLPRLQRYRSLSLTRDDWTYIAAAGAVGVLFGGRLGYVLFYEPMYYLVNPLRVIAIWEGGMSSHGGFIGVAIALYAAARYLKINVWSLADIAVIPTAAGLALGRLGNWINQELYIADSALIAVAVHAALFFALIRLVRVPLRTGMLSGVFLVVYGVQRIIFEEFRVVEWPIIFELTRGQLLTLPVLCIGLWILYQRNQEDKKRA